jgi:hypothetical protein
METKIQFVTRNALPAQGGILGIEDSFRGIASPDSFKYECSLEWAIGKNILVEQFLVIKGRNVIGEESTRNTLGHFAEKWKDMF